LKTRAHFSRAPRWAQPVPVAPTSKSAVSRISKSANRERLNGRGHFRAPPIWKPALRGHCPDTPLRAWLSPANRPFSSVPIFYECQRCTACCRWPGQVRLSDEEIIRLAAFKQVSEFELIQRFTRLRPDRLGLTLMEKPDGGCIFLEGNDCSVQPVKPRQCRDFPNLWNFPDFQKVCHAIPRLVGDEEYKQLVARAPTSPDSPRENPAL
jgi:Fe-S-cluster containining protein